MDNARTTPDILRQFEQPGRRKLSNVTSPISLFILKNDGNLAIIAIQSHPRKGIHLVILEPLRNLRLKLFGRAWNKIDY